MKKICVYGKGGIGKSTTVSNLAAAFAYNGYKTAVVGCDPKADSTRNLMGRRIDTVLDIIHSRKEGDIFALGFRDIICIEAGGPSPGTGCAGRGVVVALEEIDKAQLLKDRDVVIYDVLGDVVCGGFSAPLRENVADDVYIVTTSDFMSLYAANNICIGIFGKEHGADIMNVMALIPQGRFKDLKEPSGLEMTAAKITAEKYMHQLNNCGRCRADAVGIIDCAKKVNDK